MFHDSFVEFNKTVQSEFSSLEGSFDTKSAYLVTIQACIGFSHVECQLINYRKVQQNTRDLVSKEAAKIEASIEESSDWDRIDESLLKFEVAIVLDNFIGGDVTSRLRTLQRLRDQKEHQVDDLMATMIKNRDFKGIGEFLRPLAHSKDQVKRQKLESHLSVISSYLKEILHEIDRLIDINSNLTSNSRPVAKKIEVLVAAESDLGRLLSSQLNLTYELRKLRQQMNDFLCHFTEQITAATKDKDYIQMLRNRRQGSDFLSNMQHHLIQRHISSFESAVDKSKMELEAVPRYVLRFFESEFEDGNDLIKAMNSLKQVKDTGSFPKLAEKYESEKKGFEAKVSDEIQSVKAFVSESQCYDDSIIYVHSLHRQLQGALKDHCSHHLVTECLRLTEEFRRQKSCNDRFLELDGKSYHQNLDKLSHQLDTLSSPSIWKKVRSVWSSSYNDNKTYKRMCNELLRKVEGRFKQASVALKARDLVSVQESIEFLELVHQKADKHVQIVGSILQNLRNDCIAAFSKLCDEAKQILSSDNCIPFKEIFIDYRGYIIHIPCVLQSLNGRKGFALINQMLHESLEKAVLVLRELASAEILESSRLKAHVQFEVLGQLLGRSFDSFARGSE